MRVELYSVLTNCGRHVLTKFTQKIYHGEDCSRNVFKIIGLGIALFYVLITGVILYFESFVYSLMLQVASLFVLTSGYAIPILFRISQVNLAAGLKPLLVFGNNLGEGENDASMDLSIHETDTYQSPTERGKIEGDYFKDYYGEQKHKQQKGLVKKKNYAGLFLPYIALLLVLLTYFAILFNPIRLLIQKST